MISPDRLFRADTKRSKRNEQKKVKDDATFCTWKLDLDRFTNKIPFHFLPEPNGTDLLYSLIRKEFVYL